jgi:hypothetical protein
MAQIGGDGGLLHQCRDSRVNAKWHVPLSAARQCRDFCDRPILRLGSRKVEID